MFYCFSGLPSLSIFLRMHYTIFFNDKPLVLTDSMTGFAQEVFQKPNTVFLNQLDEASVGSMIRKMQEQNVEAGVFLHRSLDALLQAFKQKMEVIEAGGGLVHTDEKTFLLIFRRGKWDLPKGKRDDGETLAETALREVQEETGLSALQIEAPLTITYHTYYEKSKLILKESHWFLMKSTGQETMTPQLEEDIEKCEWVNTGALLPYIQNMQPSVITVLGMHLLNLSAAKTF